jgi:rod shape-determining protein MreC
MDSLLNRYRNITVLVLVIMAQLILLAYQVKSDNDVRLIRVWAVTAVMPLARTLEAVRSGVTNFVGNYITLHDTRDQNRQMREEMGRLKMENQFLRSELSSADRARALSVFQAHTQSQTLAARVIGGGAGAGSKVVFVDRGSVSGVEKGMAVVTPDGIVGKVIAAFPRASEVLLITDSTFAAGVISQKNRVHGILKGQGYGACRVEGVQDEEKLEPGEWFFTSGDDRVFPKGMPAGEVKVARHGSPFKEVLVDPSGLQNGLEDVLIVLEGVHQQIPELPNAGVAVHLQSPPPPDTPGAPVTAPNSGNTPGTDADKLRERYKAIGAAQGHTFGEGLPGSKPPDFNLPLPAASPPPKPNVTPSDPAAKPSGTKTPATNPPAASPPVGRSPANPPANPQ